ncbi:hypothetical protein [Rhodopirellula sp. SWK7]|uniref:hypothetical protein n=1 Tax=Rhodopirellula sp. SWK7 TaxID=595460 RepID=UPI0002BF8F3B|nr:hypothetical protein [Rhodopirellula sp. SWK7]EMI43437.1 secreted protein [Rhodopirellula sp. SWK7]
MKYFVFASLILVASVSVTGCQESQPEVAYDSTDVEQFLDAHPELKEEQPLIEPSSDD